MNILIVEDQFFIIEAYLKTLNKDGTSFRFLEATDCKKAYEFITSEKEIHLAIIDYSLPEFKEKNLHNGIDVLLLLKNHHPECRTVIITAHNEAVILYNIYKKANPNVLITKNDVSSENFKDIVLSDTDYVSGTVKRTISILNNKEELLDDNNRHILMCLKNGFKVSEISPLINVSDATIHKRIAKLKDSFNAKDISELIKKSTEQKFI